MGEFGLKKKNGREEGRTSNLETTPDQIWSVGISAAHSIRISDV